MGEVTELSHARSMFLGIGLHHRSNQNDDDIDELRNQIKALMKEKNALSKVNKEQEERIKFLETEIKKKEARIRELENRVQSLEENMTRKDLHQQNLDAEMEGMKLQIEELLEGQHELRRTLGRQGGALAHKDALNAQLIEDVKNYNPLVISAIVDSLETRILREVDKQASFDHVSDALDNDEAKKSIDKITGKMKWTKSHVRAIRALKRTREPVAHPNLGKTFPPPKESAIEMLHDLPNLDEDHKVKLLELIELFYTWK